MILSYEKIEDIADAAIVDFREFLFEGKYDPSQPMPMYIDQFASDYLKLEVHIERLCTDGSICGLTAYADTELIVDMNGVSVPIPIKQNQVLMDISLIQPGMVQKLCGKRRFTLAHECAHQILYQLDSDETKAACRKLYAGKREYTARELKTNEDWNEWQANALGACLILPRHDVGLVMDYYMHGRKLVSWNGNLGRMETQIIKNVSTFFHASPSAVRIRLQRLGYIEERSVGFYDEHREVYAQ